MKTILCALAILAVAGYSSAFAADGFCTISGTTNWNMTGGAGGTTSTVTTASAFISAVQASGARVVIVQGDVGDVGSITVASAKTIQGACSGGTVHGSLNLDRGVNNIILSNLTMVGGPITSADAVSILGGAHHIFVTHCDLSEAHDELCSVTKTADYVTVSWNKFHYSAPGSHTFGGLVGSDNTFLADSNKLHVTFHHNWYSTNMTQRMPRVRFGQNHVYNNYYGCPGNSYCVGVAFHCRIRLESAYFDGVDNTWADFTNGGWYEFGWNNDNVYTNGTTAATWAVNSNATIFTPPYPYTLHDGADVKSVVIAYAGPQCESSPPPPVAAFIRSPSNGPAPLAVTFTDLSIGEITNRFWAFGDGNTSNTTATTMDHTYNGGTFNVSLIVSGTGGISTNTKANYVVATGGGGSPPDARFTASPINGVEPLVVTFSDVSTGTPPLSLTWNLGNTTTNTAGGASFQNSYSAGTYSVTLTASNSAGTSTLVSNDVINVVTVFQAWQLQYFSSTNCSLCGGDADFDGDGVSNTNEFLSGTDPSNSGSALRITSAVPQGTNVVVTWTTAGGKTNAVQASSGDVDGGYSNNFVDITTSPHIIIPGSGDFTTNYVDEWGTTNIPSRFYRIRLVP